MRNGWLLTGGILSALAALAHLLCIIGGPNWYRFFGAGEGMARLAERGSLTPVLITVTIAGMLAVWSLYARSGSGYIDRLPLLRPVLLAIAAVYLLRAAALPIMLKTMADRGTTFLIISSIIVLVYGLIHAIGLYRGWNDLG